MSSNLELLTQLQQQRKLPAEDWRQLLSTYTPADRETAAKLAQTEAQAHFGRKIFFRGIVEFSNYCKNDCYYCGIRRGNHQVSRYRLTEEDILSCCDSGYQAGFRTFVLQGGEDPWYSDDRIAQIVAAIRRRFPDCAITLSIGEKERQAYQRFFDAGANRYLLRHETADAAHYRQLHPAAQSLENRLRCLWDLKDIGYQTGCGMMVGSPGQTVETLTKDMLFLSEFQPQMVGLGPFLPHHQTPFAQEPAGSTELTLLLLSLCRLLLPQVLLPATTALGTVAKQGRQWGVLAGANVIMPNLSPPAVRKNYLLYDNKAITGDDAAESLNLLEQHLAEIGYHLTVSRGDYQQGGATL